MPQCSRDPEGGSRVAARLLASLLLIAPVTGQGDETSRDRRALLFDDFSYTSLEAFIGNEWIARTSKGWPGVEGATWEGALSFVADESHPGNRVLRMTASTDGTTTQQAQFCHQRKYYEGTYAARVRFTDRPIVGPDGDEVVETFYTITPLKAPLDPDYSEQDFEYLPNGGWDGRALTLYNTTWETFRPEPEWLAVNDTHARRGSLTWLAHAGAAGCGPQGEVLPRRPTADHSWRAYYPEAPMSINFNLWFIVDGLLDSAARRSYQEDIDWVFHEAGRTLSPAEVLQTVADTAHCGDDFSGRRPSPESPAASPCDL
jgi:hypothetical protein